MVFGTHCVLVLFNLSQLLSVIANNQLRRPYVRHAINWNVYIRSMCDHLKHQSYYIGLCPITWLVSDLHPEHSILLLELIIGREVFLLRGPC